MRTKLFSVILHILALLLPVQAQGSHWNFAEPPHIRPVSPIFQTNLNTTTSPQGAPKAGTVFLEGTKMVDATIYVSSQAELYEALQKATGGETILLSQGDFGSLRLGDYTSIPCKFDSTVTISSVDPDAPATISALKLVGGSNLTFSNVLFDYDFTPGDSEGIYPFQILGSSSISITDSVFDGDLASETDSPADGYGTGNGLYVRNSSDIAIENNVFYNWYRAANFANSTGLDISSNEIHSIRSDGMDFVQVQDVIIRSNYIHDFITSPETGDHPDFIQFWSAGATEPSVNITIDSNILIVGEGGVAQTIFMRNEAVDTGLYGMEMYYKNVAITNNYILASDYHGITIGEVDGLVVQSNSVLAASTYNSIPSINISRDAINVLLKNNASVGINGFEGQPSWILSSNAFIQPTDINGVGYYGSEFIDSSSTYTSAFPYYIATSGGLIENLDAGSSHIFAGNFKGTIFAGFDVYSSLSAPGTFVFDASPSFSYMKGPIPDGSQFIWSLDGVPTYEGITVEHNFSSSGEHVVQLSILAPDGYYYYASSEVKVDSPEFISFDETSGVFHIDDYETEVTIEGFDLSAIKATGGSYFLSISDGGEPLRISKSYIERIYGAHDFGFEFEIQSDTPFDYGEIFRLHNFFLCEVGKSGNLIVSLVSNSGEVLRLDGGDIVINDGSRHVVDIQFDGSSGLLEVYVDGSLADSDIFLADLPDRGYWDFTFGNPFGGKSFGSSIFAFDSTLFRPDHLIWRGESPLSAADGDSFDLVVEGADSSYSQAPAIAVDETVEFDVDTSVNKDDSSSLTVDGAQALWGAETDGFRLSFSDVEAGSFARLVGNAFVDLTRGAIDFDGRNDGLRFDLYNFLGDSGSGSVNIRFSFDQVGIEYQTLFDNSGDFDFLANRDSIGVRMRGDSSGQIELFSAGGLNLDDGETHEARVIFDQESDHVQILVDGAVVLDSNERDFEFGSQAGSEFWWTRGFSIGDGGRRGLDFSGSLYQFSVDHEPLFFDV